ncbi:MAG: hypothetical protein QXU93_08050 [Thermoproteus sp.]
MAEFNLVVLSEWPMGLTLDQAHYIAAGILAAYIGYKVASLLWHEQVQRVLADVVREMALWAFVFMVILQYSSVVGYMNQYFNNLYAIANDSYDRIVAMAYCTTNLALSGPLAPYSSVASAKFSIYQSAYYTVLNTGVQIVGAAHFIVEYGFLLLAVGFLLYAAWLRPLGGAIIGIVMGVAMGVAVLGSWAPTQIQLVGQQALQYAQNLHPFTATGCDDYLIGHFFSEDLQGWMALAYAYIFTIVAASAAGGALGFLLGRI